MAKNKRQHYVPQHYLKGFSQDKESFYQYNIKNKKSSLTSIKKSCQISYFYGKELDEILWTFENKQAPIIRKLIKTQNLGSLTSEDLIHLYLFLLLQSARTDDSKQLSNKWVESFASKFIKPMLKSDKEFEKKGYTKEYIDSCEIRDPALFTIGILGAIQGIESISDLRPVLIINKTAKNFICSDAPVVFHNYKKIKNKCTTGYLAWGLQIFCPLADNILILLIDKKLYDLKMDTSSSIFINDDSDVDSLNKLQISNCLNDIYFSRREDVDYVENLHLEVEYLIDEKKVKLNTVETTQIDDHSYSEIVSMHIQNNINFELKLSFIKLNRLNSKKYKGMVKKLSKSNPNFVLVRNKEISDCRSDQMENEYKSQIYEQ